MFRNDRLSWLSSELHFSHCLLLPQILCGSSALYVVARVAWRTGARTCISVTGGIDSRRSGDPMSGPLSDSLTTFSAAVLLPLVNIFAHLDARVVQPHNQRQLLLNNATEVTPLSNFCVASVGCSTTSSTCSALLLTSEPPPNSTPSRPPPHTDHESGMRARPRCQEAQPLCSLPDHLQDPNRKIPRKTPSHAPSAPRITQPTQPKPHPPKSALQTKTHTTPTQPIPTLTDSAHSPTPKSTTNQPTLTQFPSHETPTPPAQTQS